MRCAHALPVVAVAALATSAWSQASFQGIGGITPTSMSGDGTVIVGPSGSSAAMWTESGGLMNLGGEGGQVTISPDGSTITGNTLDMSNLETAGIWQGGTSWMSLGGVPGGLPSGSSLSSNYGVSTGGSVVVGLGWIDAGTAHAFRWDATNGMVDLGSLTSRSSRANAVSADGEVIVGWNDEENGFRRAAKWINGTPEWIDPVATGEAASVNPDGSVIVGGFAGAGNTEAWRWTSSGGLEPIGKPPGPPNHRAYATDTSDDGRVIVGFSGFGIDRDAFIWIEGAGIYKLDTYLMDCGATGLSGWDLGTATAISADGTVIAGWGLGPNGFQGWVATIPIAPTVYCTAKVNSCGTVPTIATAGLPSASASSGFDISVAQSKAGKAGLALYSDMGRAGIPFMGGFLCVAAPIQRSIPVFDSSGSGSACDGVLAIDMNAFASGSLGGNPAGFLIVPGTRVTTQFWGRDTQSDALLSDAVEYGVCP